MCEDDRRLDDYFEIFKDLIIRYAKSYVGLHSRGYLSGDIYQIRRASGRDQRVQCKILADENSEKYCTGLSEEK